MIVIFDAAVWEQLLVYVPYPSAVDLQPSIRIEVRGATLITRRGSMPTSLRVVSLTPEQAEELEVWLAVVVDRADAPAALRDALDAVSEARRHTQ